jgi:hypothetical protein
VKAWRAKDVAAVALCVGTPLLVIVGMVVHIYLRNRRRRLVTGASVDVVLT